MEEVKLLMIIQKLEKNDSIFAFLIDWLNELNKNVDKLYVLALYKGKYSLEKGIEVFSMGKEKKQNKLFYLLNLYRIVLPLCWKKKINGIFVFQGGMYPFLLWIVKKLFSIKLIQWKVHSVVDSRMRWNLRAVDKVITASTTCFDQPSGKIRIVGHGVNTETFKEVRDVKKQNLILVVGRISRIKRLREIIDIFSKLIKEKDFQHYRLEFAGIPQTEKDNLYWDELHDFVRNTGLELKVNFRGKVNFQELPRLYTQAKVSLNLGNIGSLDKVILESMACKTPAIMITPAIKDQLGEYEDLLYAENDDAALLNMIKILKMGDDEYNRLGNGIREIVLENHSLSSLMKKIKYEFQSY
jgi:glycosyltransferase involved in cell wall biosynthesis